MLKVMSDFSWAWCFRTHTLSQHYCDESVFDGTRGSFRKSSNLVYQKMVVF